MRDVPPSMQGDLGEWNGGDGIDLESWVSCSGSYQLAVGYAEYFWPDFQELNGYITRVGSTVDSLREWEKTGSTRRSIEAVMNHIHLIDINYSDHENLKADLLLRLGEVLKEIYEAKLLWQFPDRPCRVSLFIPEDPNDFSCYELTFWQISHEQLQDQSASGPS